MDKSLQDKYNLLNEASGSGLQNDSSSEYSSTTSDSDEDSRNPTVNDNLPDDYQIELETDLEKTHKKRPKTKENKPKVRKTISKIPSHLKGLMGEANLRFARGDHETAEKMCYEVIRQAPHAFEPYVTLSQLHENTQQIEKSVQYLTIAAHLNPNDVDQWLRLAQHHVEKKNYKAAVTCYNRAIKAQPKNSQLHEQRIQILEVLNDNKLALRCKARLLQVYSRKQYATIMEKAKELAEVYYKEKDYAKAIDILNVPFTKCRKHITPEMVNIFLELLLLNKNFHQCLDVFVQFCNIEIEIMIDDDSKVHILSYNMPAGIQIDLQIKFIVCLIKLEAFNLIDKMLEPLLKDEENVETIGDLYLDVAEALMSTNRHLDALKLLIPLIKSANFSLAAVWLKYAECLKACNMHEQAIESYFNVVRLAPQHMEVRYPLSELLIDANRDVEALQILKQDPNGPEIDVGLLIKEMEVLKRLKKYNEYFNCIDTLLRRHCIHLEHQTELQVVTFQQSLKFRTDRINHLRELREAKPISYDLKSIREPSIEDEYKLFRDILNFCYQNGFYKQLKKFSFYALGSSRFKNYNSDITMAAFFACICTRDSFHAYPIIRDILMRKNKSTNHLMWNLFNLTMQTQDELRQHRFIMRLSKNKDYDFMKILEAHNALSSASYKIATIYLMPFLKLHPTPFIYFLLGVVFLQVNCQKQRDIKKKLTQCSYGLFLNYANKRGKAAQHEVCYNLGRLYHQYGILQIAAYYYKLVLEFKHPLIEAYPHVLDLKREAAFNLVLIYKDSENFVGARNLMIKYLTI